MLSSVLHSDTAVDVSVKIMDAFVAMRHFIASNAQVFQRLEVIEHHQLEMSSHLTKNDHQIAEIFKRLDQENTTPTQGIFFDGQIFDAYTFVSDLIRSANMNRYCVSVSRAPESTPLSGYKRGSFLSSTTM